MVEFLGVILSAVSGWFLGLYKGYGFYGISIAMNLTMFAVLGMYHGFFCFGKDFKEYWQEIKDDSHYNTDCGGKVLLVNEEEDPLNSSPQNSNKHEENENLDKQEEPQNSEEFEDLENSAKLEELKNSEKLEEIKNSAKHEELQNSEKCEGENLKIYKNYICWGMTFALSN